MTSRVCYLDQYVFIYVGHRGLNSNLNCIQSDMVSVALAPPTLMWIKCGIPWQSQGRERLPSAITKEFCLNRSDIYPESRPTEFQTVGKLLLSIWGCPLSERIIFEEITIIVNIAIFNVKPLLLFLWLWKGQVGQWY